MRAPRYLTDMTSKKPSGCFRTIDDTEEPVDQVRFAIGGEDGRLSSEWVAACARGKSSDIFLATKGMSNDIKVTFHDRDVIVGFLKERVPHLRERGLLREGESRQRSSVPVQRDGAWIAARIDFIAGALRTSDRAIPLRKGKAITLLPAPPPGYLRRIVVAHAFGSPPQVRLHDTLLQPFARIENGDRHVAFFTAVLPIDVAAEEKRLKGFVEQIRSSPETLDVADAGNLAAVMWGDDGDHLNFLEVHNIVRKVPNAS